MPIYEDGQRCDDCDRNLAQIEEHRMEVVEVEVRLRTSGGKDWCTVVEGSDVGTHDREAWCYRCFIRQFGCTELASLGVRGWQDQVDWSACPSGERTEWEAHAHEAQKWLEARELQYFDDTDMFAEESSESSD